MPARRTKPARIEAQHKKDLADAHARGRTRGLGDALLLVGVGIGLGVATALVPPRPGKCLKQSAMGDPCRLDAGHDGDCQPERLLKP